MFSLLKRCIVFTIGLLLLTVFVQSQPAHEHEEDQHEHDDPEGRPAHEAGERAEKMQGPMRAEHGAPAQHVGDQKYEAYENRSHAVYVMHASARSYIPLVYFNEQTNTVLAIPCYPCYLQPACY